MRYLLVLLVLFCFGEVSAAPMSAEEMMRIIEQRRLCQEQKIGTRCAALQPTQSVQAVQLSPRETVKSSNAGQIIIAHKSDDQLQVQARTDFNEFSVYAGGWINPQGSSGIWSMGEFLHWKRTDGSVNYGFGAVSQLDYGWGKNDSHWGYASVGPAFSLYTEMGLDDSFQIKLRPQYRFSEHPKADGWMPGAYVEYDHVLGRNDKLFLTADGHYFKNDSWLGLNAYWEHRFNRVVKTKLGFGVNWNFFKDVTPFGFGPSLSVKLYDRFVLGWSANFIEGGPLYGFYAGYELNTDLMELDASIREKSITLKKPAMDKVSIIAITPNQIIPKENGQ